MHQSKLFALLKTFEKSEWKSFRGFLIWQTREEAEVVAIYDYISKYKESLTHKQLSVDIACKVLFKLKTRKNFLNLLSKLASFVTDYLATQEVMKDKRAMQLNSVLALNRRGLYDEALKSRKQLRTIIERAPLDIWNAYYKLRASHAIQFSDNPIKKSARKETYLHTFTAFKELFADLHLYYLLDAEHITLISREDMMSEINLLRSVNIKVNSLNTQLLTLLIKLVKTESTLAFEELYILLLHTPRKMEVSIGTLTLLHMMQHQIRELKKGRGEMEKLHLLYEYGVQNELLFDNGKIADGRFTQWIEIVCLTDNPQRGYEVINDWSHAVHPQTREEVISLSRGYCHFYNNNYADSVAELSTFPYKQRYSKNSSREVLLMNYMHLYSEELDFLLTQINNYREYRNRHWKENSKLHHEGCENFLKIITRIAKNKNLNSILEDINKEQYLIRRIWLRKFIKEKGAK